jgi:hypothetical protein
MGDKRAGSVIVNSKGKPSVIYTEQDLLSKFLVRGTSLDEPIGKHPHPH